MPLNPNIPLGVQPVAPISVLGSYGRALQIQEQQMQNRRAQQAAKDADAKAKREEQVRGILTELRDDKTSTFNYAEVARRIGAIDPVMAADWWDRAQTEEKHHVAVQKDQATRAGQVAAGILAAPAEQRPTLYASARAEWLRQDPTAAQRIPEAYDEAWLTNTRNNAESIVDQLTRLEKAASAELAKREQARKEAKDAADVQDKKDDNARQDKRDAETHRHNLSMEAAARAQKPKDVDADPTFDRDFKLYQEYLRAHENAQKERPTAHDENGIVVMEGNQPGRVPYQPAKDWNTWRRESTGIGIAPLPRGATAPAPPNPQTLESNDTAGGTPPVVATPAPGRVNPSYPNGVPAKPAPVRVKVKRPDGQTVTVTFPSQEKADAFKRAAGIK